MKRVALLGQLLTLVALGVGVAVADTMPVRYSGAPIVLREWLAMVSAVVGGLTALGLAVAAVATPNPWARGAWGLGAAVALAHATVPWWLGSGPWLHGGAEVRMLTLLMWVPAAARAFGVIVAGLRIPRYSGAVVTTLGLADLCGVLWLGLATPVAVIARAHPAQGELAWLAAAAGAVGLMLTAHRSR